MESWIQIQPVGLEFVCSAFVCMGFPQVMVPDVRLTVIRKLSSNRSELHVVDCGMSMAIRSTVLEGQLAEVHISEVRIPEI